MTDPQLLFVVEYPCGRHCRVELDVDGDNPRLTVGMLARAADEEHERACTLRVGAGAAFRSA
jgi:hypothetical protein